MDGDNMLFEGFSPFEISALAELVAVILADDLDVDDLNVLGAFVTSVGDLISLIAAQKEYLKNISDQNNEIFINR
jgi:hypothetical protein